MEEAATAAAGVARCTVCMEYSVARGVFVFSTGISAVKPFDPADFRVQSHRDRLQILAPCTPLGPRPGASYSSSVGRHVDARPGASYSSSVGRHVDDVRVLLRTVAHGEKLLPRACARAHLYKAILVPSRKFGYEKAGAGTDHGLMVREHSLTYGHSASWIQEISFRQLEDARMNRERSSRLRVWTSMYT